MCSSSAKPQDGPRYLEICLQGIMEGNNEVFASLFFLVRSCTFEIAILQVAIRAKAVSAAFVRSVKRQPSVPKDFLLHDSSILPSSCLIVCLSPLVPSRIPRPVADSDAGVAKRRMISQNHCAYRKERVSGEVVPFSHLIPGWRNRSAHMQQHLHCKIPAGGLEARKNQQRTHISKRSAFPEVGPVEVAPAAGLSSSWSWRERAVPETHLPGRLPGPSSRLTFTLFKALAHFRDKLP